MDYYYYAKFSKTLQYFTLFYLLGQIAKVIRNLKLVTDAQLIYGLVVFLVIPFLWIYRYLL